MATETMQAINPTSALDLDFGHYLEAQERRLGRHTIDGVPDYAFSLDQKMRQGIAGIGPLRSVAQALVSNFVPIERQRLLLEAVAAGPRQYPEIHAMGEECARRLGIGVPQIFVEPSQVVNAFALATEDVEPVVILTTALVDVMDTAELAFIVGHECGHIHNLHGVYNTAVEILANPAINILGIQLPAWVGWVQQGFVLLLLQWARHAEITCDRAGLICSGNLEASTGALAKLATSGSGKLGKLNVEEYVKQVKQVPKLFRLRELIRSHPLTPKRLQALELFAECEVLYDWRPEMRTSSAAKSKAEVDAACEEVVAILS